MTSEDAKPPGTGRDAPAADAQATAEDKPNRLVVDRSVLAVIGQQIGSERAMELLRQALDEVDATSLRLRNEALSLADVEVIAHRLKGTALAFGLLAVGALAAQIELLARAGEPSMQIRNDLAVAGNVARQVVDRGSLLGG